MADDRLSAAQLKVAADAMILAAASMTTLAVSQVVIASSSALSTALLAAPVHQANVHTKQLATTARAVDTILGNGDPPPPPSNAVSPEMKKFLGLLSLMKANDGAPVVT